MICKYCGSTVTQEQPHPIHGARVSCKDCGKFLTWKGKEQDPQEYYNKMAALAKERGFKPGFAYMKFREKFGRTPTAEEQKLVTSRSSAPKIKTGFEEPMFGVKIKSGVPKNRVLQTLFPNSEDGDPSDYGDD